MTVMTLHGIVQGDNDPTDVVEIGSRQLKRGGVYSFKPLGVFALIDQDEFDWKVRCHHIVTAQGFVLLMQYA